MSFFIKGKGKSKQNARKAGNKRVSDTVKTKSIPKKKKFTGPNEEIESDSDIADDDEVSRDKGYSSSEEEEETAQEKKLRLAKQYLSQIEAEERDKHIDTEEYDQDAVSKRLKHDQFLINSYSLLTYPRSIDPLLGSILVSTHTVVTQLELSGKLQRQVASDIEVPTVDSLILFRGHQLSVTCVVVSPNSEFVYSAGKDCSIIKWSLKERKRMKTIHGGRKGTDKKHIGHTAHILALALSSDGKYLASGDVNKLIHIWDTGPLELLHTFKGHRDAVTGLTFRKDTHELYSCSNDRAVKIWNVDERAYVETLFGHQDKITAIDSLSRERAITAGGRDSSVRVWKILEESQLVFNAHTLCSIDCIALINETNFISGTDDNSLSLWGAMKKKPLTTVRNAHGSQGTDVNTSVSHGQECWITAVAALHNTDLVASGSKDGSVRLWKCSANCRKLEPLFAVPVTGFVNSLQFSSDGQYLVAGIGQEHRLGRWWTNKQAKNGICVIPLNSHVT